jgi:vitellogenic carboxypeptidase-like protein
MTLLTVILFAGIHAACGRGAFRKQFPHKIPPIDFHHGDPGLPLFLTPYIEKGDIAHAQQLAIVGPLNGTSVLSYAGFLTVNKTFNSNMFMWFFPSQTKGANDPVLLWLQGGPGGSSLFGLLVENGPFGVDKNLQLFPRKFSWNAKYNVLYIDNPVGTGFSFADDGGYARTEDDVAENLYVALVQFFTLFPDLKDNELYLTGESYAGKYIPALAARVHREKPPRKFHLRGAAIGDGFSDPPVMIPAYAEFMFQTGLLDENQRDYFRNRSNAAVQLMNQGRWVEADKVFDELLDDDQFPYPSFFTNCTGAVNYYNYLRSTEPDDYKYYSSWLQLSDIRRSIHVGNTSYQEGGKVEEFLLEDLMQSVKPQLAEAMNFYKVMLYSGQLDVIVALPLTEAMLLTVPWKYQSEYLRAKRQIWKVQPTDREVAGYVRRVHDFYQVMVRGGGHILPYDQPERTWDMLDRFITGRPFNI